MFGLELWFVFAIASVVFNGLGAFSIKVAAHRQYNSKFVVCATGFGTIVLLLPLAVVFSGFEQLTVFIASLGLVSGLIISWVAITKINALRYIDTTIYFPLFKVVSPLIAIGLGAFFFADKFTSFEWIGLILSLLVPLLLITPSENQRQDNLKLGLLLVLLTGIVSAAAAAIQKYATDISDAVLWIVFFSQLGVTIGAFSSFVHQHSLSELFNMTKSHLTSSFGVFYFWRVIVIVLGFATAVYAYDAGGSLGIVYTIVSLYILITIVLSIIFYNEHWNAQKVVAIVLSIAALWFLK